MVELNTPTLESYTYGKTESDARYVIEAIKDDTDTYKSIKLMESICKSLSNEF